MALVVSLIAATFVNGCFIRWLLTAHGPGQGVPVPHCDQTGCWVAWWVLCPHGGSLFAGGRAAMGEAMRAMKTIIIAAAPDSISP